MTASGPDAQLLRDLARRNWLILGVLVAGSLLWQSIPVTLGVVGGGLLVIVGHHWRYRALKNMLAAPGPGSKRGFQFGYIIRLTTMAAAIYLLIVPGRVNPLALVVGLSVVTLNILVTTLTKKL